VTVPENSPSHTLGDVVQVEGRTGAYFGEQAPHSEAGGVIKTADGDLPEPVNVRTGDVGPDTEGSLVRLDGEVVSASKPRVRLDDGSGEARVRVADTTGIVWPSPRKGDALTVIGVASSFNEGFQVLPRFEDDLALEREPEPTSSPAPTATPEPPDGGDSDPTATPEPPTVPISVARSLADGVVVRIVGSVTAPSHLVGPGRLYVHDDAAGILVLIPDASPPYRPGDVLRVEGAADSYYGERALRAADGGVQRLDAGEPPEVRTMRTGEVGPRTEGLLVRVRGSVTNVSKPRIGVDDGSGEARVRIADSTGVAWPAPRKGDELTAVGVVSSFNGGYRLLARFESDLTLKRLDPPPKPDADPFGPSLDEYRSTTIAAARGAERGERLRIEGSVTAPPGPLGERLMYIQDAGSGILITGELPSLPLGAVVRIEGVAGTYHSERRLDADNVTMLGVARPYEALDVSLAEVGPAAEGLLVRVVGAVARSGWPSLWLEPGEVRVLARKSSRIENPRARRGDGATAVGVVSQWDGKHSVLLRYADDLSLTRTPKQDRSSGGSGAGTPDVGWRTTTVEALRRLPLGVRVSFVARVTARPGVLGEARTYVGSEQAGVALHKPGGGYADLDEGDRVRVRGELDEYHGELVVRLESGRDVQRLGPGELVSPTLIRTGAVGFLTEGRLVRVGATITRRS